MAAKTMMYSITSFTIATIAGARSPLEYVYVARIRNAMTSGSSPCRPIAANTTRRPTICSAIYGISARIPVNATAIVSGLLRYSPRTKSASVT